jgi:hypothetical protein
MVLWCSLSRASIAVVVPSGSSNRHGVIRQTSCVIVGLVARLFGEQREGYRYLVETNSGDVTVRSEQD